MDSASIGVLVSATVGMLSPYLAKIGDAVSKKAGEGLYDFVKAHFAKKPVAQAALQELEKAPQDAARQATLAAQLQEVLNQDLAFAEALKKLLHEIQQKQAESVSIEQHAGDNAKQIGQVFGPVSFGKD